MEAQADGNRVLVFVKDSNTSGNWRVIATFNHVSGCSLSPSKQAQEYASFLNRK